MRGVSAIIPVYNGAATVGRAIESALFQQVDRPVEVIVVNDGSTDSTAEILENYRSRIKVATQPNRGPAAARNAGVNISNGEYLAFLDADDVWLPGKLINTCEALDRNEQAVLAFSGAILATEDGRVPLSYADRAPSMADLLSVAWPIFPSMVVMRRTVFDLCGGFCEEFNETGFEDPYMWMLAREYGEFVYVKEPLVVYTPAAFRERADKYEGGRLTFTRLVRERYGRSAKPLISSIRAGLAPSLVQKALLQMDSGDGRGALKTWLRAVRLSPSYFLDFRHFVRAMRPRNLKRLLKAVAPT